MSTIIAVTGKGGTGKTTIAALLTSRLIHHGCKPVLAVDADPNTCLDAALGVQAENTVGRIREEARKIAAQGMGAGISKHELLDLKIQECLTEAQDFDLLAIGGNDLLSFLFHRVLGDFNAGEGLAFGELVDGNTHEIVRFGLNFGGRRF